MTGKLQVVGLGGGKFAAHAPQFQSTTGDGEGGMDSNERLAKLESRIDTALPTLATKADIADVKAGVSAATADVVKWVAGSAIGIVVMLVSIFAFMLNRAVPVPAPTPQSPINIYTQQPIAQPPTPPAPQSPPDSKRGLKP